MDRPISVFSVDNGLSTINSVLILRVSTYPNCYTIIVKYYQNSKFVICTIIKIWRCFERYWLLTHQTDYGHQTIYDRATSQTLSWPSRVIFLSLTPRQIHRFINPTPWNMDILRTRCNAFHMATPKTRDIFLTKFLETPNQKGLDVLADGAGEGQLIKWKYTRMLYNLARWTIYLCFTYHDSIGKC